MKKLSVLCVALCVGLSTTAAFARGGGMGSHMSGTGGMSVTGGAFGTSPAAPGTNSAGTALSSSNAACNANGYVIRPFVSSLLLKPLNFPGFARHRSRILGSAME